MTLGEPGKSRVFVLSHPNHEAAVYGLAQRARPACVFLTDGGGERRVAETRAGLGRIGLVEQAHFLNYREDAFYGALLERDTAFYLEVAKRVSEILDELRPDEVYCDAVEFYNPVHDMSLPIVRHALGREAAPVFEIPLVYQKPGPGEEYEVQRLPSSQRERALELHLSESELAAKLAIRREVYSMLVAQMGPVVCDLPAEHLGTEVVGRAEWALPRPGAERVLRYEWRGALLRERGEVSRVITYAEHYLPVASALLPA